MVTRSLMYRLYPQPAQEDVLREGHHWPDYRLEHDGASRHGRLILPDVGRVKIRLHRPLEGRVLALCIGLQAGEWHACFICRVAPAPIPAPEEAVGVDFGVTLLATDSAGRGYCGPRAFRQAEKGLRRAHRIAARRQPGSRRRQRAEERVRRAELRIIRSRRTAAHRIARGLVDRYGLIAIERGPDRAAPAAGLVRKEAARATWGVLRRLLAQKARERGRRLVAVDPSQTSQLCPACGACRRKALSERQHVCECGLNIDRDQAAALVILQRALNEGSWLQGWAGVGRLANSLML